MILLPTLTPRLERLADAWRDPRPRPRVPELALGLLCADQPQDRDQRPGLAGPPGPGLELALPGPVQPHLAHA